MKNYLLMFFGSLALVMSACQSPEGSSGQPSQRERVIKVTLNDGAPYPSPAQQARIIERIRASEHVPDDIQIKLVFEEYQANSAMTQWSEVREAILSKYHLSERDIAYAPNASAYVPPMYPYRMRLQGKDGTCDFIFTVNPNGTPAEIYLVQTTEMEFAQHAEYALKQWRFPVSDSARLARIHFNFTGGSDIDWRPSN